MKGISLTTVFLLLVIFFANISAQSIGKIFNKTDADTIFGKVYFSHKIDGKLIQKILDDTTSVTMFKVTKNILMILDKHRKAIYPDSVNVGVDEPFYLYSKDKLKELFDKSDNKTEAVIEMRGSTLTITSGNLTLEQTVYCPPICW